MKDNQQEQRTDKIVKTEDKSALKETKRSKKGTADGFGARVKGLVAIVSEEDGKEIAEILNRNSAALCYAFEGHGTARSAMLDYFGLDERAKRVLLALIPESAEHGILESVQREMSLYLVGKGICFTLPLTGVSRIVANGLLKSVSAKDGVGRKRKVDAERKYDLIVVAVESGYAEEVMDAARAVGAGGGTLIRATTLEKEKAEQLIGVTMQTETELLLILAKREGKATIMKAIQEKTGLKTDAGGILFSLPVDNLVGVGNENIGD